MKSLKFILDSEIDISFCTLSNIKYCAHIIQLFI